MKKLLTALAAVLAINFLATAGYVGFLFKSGKLNHDKVSAIRDIVFTDATQPASTAPVAVVTPAEPTDRLGLLLAEKSKLDVTSQDEFVQKTYDVQLAEIDRRKEELSYRESNLEKLQAQVDTARKALDDARAQFQTESDQADKLASDKGFQETLDLYSSMKAPQAKALLAPQDDQSVVHYLEAMDPKQSTKIMAEFKTPDEVTRLAHLMEMMRASPTSDPAAP